MEEFHPIPIAPNPVPPVSPLPQTPVPPKILRPLSDKISRKRFWLWSAVAIVVVAVVGGLIYHFAAPGPVKPVALPPQFTSADRLQLQELITDKKDYAGALTLATQMSQEFPDKEDVWLFKGIAEFQLNKFTDAKASFDKVLALDPNSEPAKKYEAALPPPGVTRVTFTPVAQKDFEALLGVQLDPQELVFSSAFTIPTQSGYTKSLAANYISTTTIASVTKYLTGVLGVSPDSSSTSKTVTFHKTLTGQNADYAVFVNQMQKTTLIAFSYNEH